MRRKVIWALIIALLVCSSLAGFINAPGDYREAKSFSEKFVAVLGLVYALSGAATICALLWKRRLVVYFASLWAFFVIACGLLAILVFEHDQHVWISFFSGLIVMLLIFIPSVIFLKRNS